MIIKVAVFASLLLFLVNSSLVPETKKGLRASKNFYLGNDRANFYQAYFNCKDGDMDLATISSQQEEEDLAYFLRDVERTPDDYLSGFWLSATNLPDTSVEQFYWLTGGKRAIYTDWLPGEPNNFNADEHCLQWTTTTSRTGWNDYVCEVETRYICEIPD